MSRSGGSAATLVAVFALVLAGCGGSETAEKPSPTPSPTATPTASAETGGPAAEPAALKAQGYVVVPRTNIALQPPKGFVLDESLPGLVRTGSPRSTFLVVQQQAPYDDPQEVVADMEAGFMQNGKADRNGLKIDSVKRLSIHGRPAVGAVGTQTAGGRIYKKALVSFPSEGFFVTITATLQSDDPLSSDDALAVLRTTRWASKSAEGELDFSIKPAEGFVELASSSGLIYTLGGKRGPGVATFIVQGHNDAGVPEGQQLAAAHAIFGRLAGNPTAETQEHVTIADLPGWELRGTGEVDGRQTKFYAAILFTDGGVVACLGTLDPDKDPDQMGAFSSMAHSLEVD